VQTPANDGVIIAAVGRQPWRNLQDITRKLKKCQPRVLEVVLGRQLDLFHFLRNTQLLPDGRAIYLPQVYVRSVHGLILGHAYLASFDGHANFES
jgi:hypothetical protein